ncbi:flavin reductase family protein [Subtercola sp. YIM 133946]|uniref:flavin reductase family protein n=1 Tax=Subtercola sp. YIM 133946 TaxID=3118909 RepID=UPI002F9442BE
MNTSSEALIGADAKNGPAAIDPLQFRRVLSHLPTGVTVVTAHGESGPIGMAANSVTSVSLEPPLILICPAKSSSTWPKIQQAGSFCVNIMARHHESVTRQFAARDADRFVGVGYTNRPTGPALSDAVAWIECVQENEYDAGDHTIVVARVVAMEAATGGDPLVFFRGSYGSFSVPSAD